MRELSFLKPVALLEQATVLDPIIKRLKPAVIAIMKPRAVEDLLHGVPAGHPVHPVLVQIPIGTWSSAAVLDLVPGASRASRLLVGVGVLSSASAIITGWADWARSRPEQQRVGLVHAAANELSTVLYALSWLDRRRGHEVRGRAISYAGFVTVTVGGYLGGHLAYRQGVGVSHAADVETRFPDGWQGLGPLDDLPEARPVRRDVDGEALLVLRRGGRVDALSNVCTHLAAPLHEGTLSVEDGATCITCPLHDSVFDVETGEVVHGPATAPEPRFETRVVAGEVEVRLAPVG